MRIELKNYKFICDSCQKEEDLLMPVSNIEIKVYCDSCNKKNFLAPMTYPPNWIIPPTGWKKVSKGPGYYYYCEDCVAIKDIIE